MKGDFPEDRKDHERHRYKVEDVYLSQVLWVARSRVDALGGALLVLGQTNAAASWQFRGHIVAQLEEARVTGHVQLHVARTAARERRVERVQIDVRFSVRHVVDLG